MKIFQGFVIFFVLLSASCSLNTDYFSEYNNVNLLKNWDFPTTSAGTPVWALATTTDYMTWSDLGAGTGPTSTSHGYQLEIKNLIPNGDFTASTAGQTLIGNPASAWSVSGSGSATVLASGTQVSTQNASTITLTAPSVQWTSQKSTDTLSLNLNSALGTSSLTGHPPLWTTGQYVLQMDFIDLFTSTPCQLNFVPTTGSAVSWTYPNSSQTNSFQVQHLYLINSSGPNGSQIGNAFSYSGANDALIFSYTSGTQDLVFSSLRLVRSDVPLNVTTSLPSLTSGSLQLIPGTYQFSVWVKDDPQAGSNNHFVATGLTITLTAATQPGNNGTFETYFPRPSAGWPTWTQLTLPLGTVDFVDYDSQHTGSPALTISLSPTNIYNDSQTLDAGSLYVASPTLQFLH